MAPINETLTDVGNGLGGLFDSLSTPLASFLIILGIAAGVVALFSAITWRIRDGMGGPSLNLSREVSRFFRPLIPSIGAASSRCGKLVMSKPVLVKNDSKITKDANAKQALDAYKMRALIFLAFLIVVLLMVLM